VKNRREEPQWFMVGNIQWVEWRVKKHRLTATWIAWLLKPELSSVLYIAFLKISHSAKF